MIPWFNSLNFSATIVPERRPLDALTEQELVESPYVLHVKILESDIGFPINLFGTVLIREHLKCVYIFRRDRDDCQLIKSSVSALSVCHLTISLQICFIYLDEE